MATGFKSCSIDGCNGNADKQSGGRRGWCSPHYLKFMRYGDPLAGDRHCMTHGKVCSIVGCSKPHYGHGWCKAHYEQWRKWGDPLYDAYYEHGPRKFIAEVVLRYSDPIACLIWPFSRNHEGYGQMRHGEKTAMANIVICEAAHGPKPSDEHEVAHSCGNGAGGCCSPLHIRWATKVENEADKILHGTTNRCEANGQAKLNADQVRKIRSLAGTMWQREIAALFDVDRRTVGKIISRDLWPTLY